MADPDDYGAMTKDVDDAPKSDWDEVHRGLTNHE